MYRTSLITNQVDQMKSICVYLGANAGSDIAFSEAVILLAKEIAESGATLIYGGSSLGLMGLLANTVKEQGGKIIGIITKQLLENEKPLSTLDELCIVDSMQERKRLMQERADIFVVMPGGLGTLEEAFETWNAIKIGIINKPIGFLNTLGFFDELFAFVKTCEKSGFVSEQHLQIPKVNPDIKLLLNSLGIAPPAKHMGHRLAWDEDIQGTDIKTYCKTHEHIL